MHTRTTSAFGRTRAHARHTWNQFPYLIGLISVHWKCIYSIAFAAAVLPQLVVITFSCYRIHFIHAANGRASVRKHVCKLNHTACTHAFNIDMPSSSSSHISPLLGLLRLRAACNVERNISRRSPPEKKETPQARHKRARAKRASRWIVWSY